MKHMVRSIASTLMIVGISSSNMRVTTYKEFEIDVLPRIKKLGYNCIQM